MPSYIAFDLEIANPFPDGVDDWRPYRPFGVSCAATLTSAGEMRVWHGAPDAAGRPGDRMSREELVGLIEHLEASVAGGATLLTWNGAGFDLDVMAEETGLGARCRDLALGHVDMMFHFFCAQGYALGLDRAARGLGLPGKTPGMNGSLAPQYWAEGRRQEVLDYVRQDARTTLDVAVEAERRRMLPWISSTGRACRLPLPRGWLTVSQALRLPLPDQSWMRDPWTRSRFTGWMDALAPSTAGAQAQLPGMGVPNDEETA